MRSNCSDKKGPQARNSALFALNLAFCPATRFSIDRTDGNSLNGVSPSAEAYSLAKLKLSNASPNTNAVAPNLK